MENRKALGPYGILTKSNQNFYNLSLKLRCNYLTTHILCNDNYVNFLAADSNFFCF